jgi:hypothetical protein
MSRLKFGSLAVFLSVILHSMWVFPSVAGEWHDPANYPAPVLRLLYRNAIIDPLHATRWGSWTVSFGSRLPVARYGSGGNYHGIDILGLICSNPVLGSVQCVMRAYFDGPSPGHRPSCLMVDRIGLDLDTVPFEGAAFRNFVVPCPNNVRLQRSSVF